MSTVAPHTADRSRRRPETRIASYLLTEYLERLGVEVIFGLCGHTVIALLDALGKSRIRFVSTRHEQVAAHAADGYARASGKTGVLLTHLGPGLTNAAHRRRQRGARFDPDGGDRRRRAVVLLRPPSAPGSQPPSGRRPVPDLPAVLQARLPRRSRRGSAAHHGARLPSGAGRAARARSWSTCRWTSSRPTCRSTRSSRCRRRWRGRPLDAATRGAHRRRAGSGRAAGPLRRRRRAVGARHRGARRARRSAGAPGRAHADGQGLPCAKIIRCCSA